MIDCRLVLCLVLLGAPASAMALTVPSLTVNSLIVNSLTVCPFCTPVAPTFSEEMKSTDAVLIAELVKRGDRGGSGGKIAEQLG
ncbi:MAG: hypothetical protein P8M80_07195, partial [Pirellulaceae bacterium]|nr:hypothetical protein [Pirellulaceae bacterium]